MRNEHQYNSLRRLARRANDYGALVYMEHPSDVSFLAPIAPELRGIEIVADPNRDDCYDIWSRKTPVDAPKPVKFNLSGAEVCEWLRGFPFHSEADFVANGARWAEEVLTFYRVPERPQGSLQ